MPQRTIDQRMQTVHMRVQIEQAYGISAVEEKEQFLALCQLHEPEMELRAQEARKEAEANDWDGNTWRDFDKWNDAPMFAVQRRKAQVG